MINPSLWFYFPLLTFFLVYKGWSLWRAVKAVIIFEMVIGAFHLGFFEGVFFVLVLGSALWVYSDAAEEKFRFPWLYGIIAFLFPLVGLIAYFLRRLIHERSLVKSGKVVNDESGYIVFRDK